MKREIGDPHTSRVRDANINVRDTTTVGKTPLSNSNFDTGSSTLSNQLFQTKFLKAFKFVVVSIP